MKLSYANCLNSKCNGVGVYVQNDVMFIAPISCPSLLPQSPLKVVTTSHLFKSRFGLDVYEECKKSFASQLVMFSHNVSVMLMNI